MNNPKTQKTFNILLAWFWGLNMPLIPLLVYRFPHAWLQISAMYIAEGTVWGIVATHIAGAIAASAAMSGNTTTEELETITDEVSDLYGATFQVPGAVISPEVEQ